MVTKNPISNDANDTSFIGPESSGDELTGPYLNADDLLKQPLPRLVRGKSGVETTKHAPRIIHHYNGKLAHWEGFKESVMEFYKDTRIKAELDRCAKVPIYMDKAIEGVNSEAMTRENIQCGAEITLSGRYFSNVLAVVASIVRTLVVPAHGKSANPTLLPKRLAFGDAKILDHPHRVSGMEPDILLKLPISGKDQIRLVGELKFFPVVDLEQKREAYLDGDGPQFRAILGQLVNYMLGHNLKYGFISNYDQTIFLKLDQLDEGKGDPCIFFSDVIRYDDLIDDTNNDVSIRLVLLYLIYKTCSPGAATWRIPDHLNVMELQKEWIVLESVNDDTIYKSGEPLVADLTDQLSSLDLQTPRKRASSFDAIFSSSPLQWDASSPYIPPPGIEQPGRSERVLRSHQGSS